MKFSIYLTGIFFIRPVEYWTRLVLINKSDPRHAHKHYSLNYARKKKKKKSVILSHYLNVCCLNVHLQKRGFDESRTFFQGVVEKKNGIAALSLFPRDSFVWYSNRRFDYRMTVWNCHLHSVWTNVIFYLQIVKLIWQLTHRFGRDV